MPINRSIGVNLAFTADTKQAQVQLNNLQNTLTQLVNTAPSKGFSGFTKELQQASTAAATLKTQLSEATNVNTGKLDLGKFNQSLKASGMTLEMYKTQLTNLGPQGVAAFGQLSQAIMNAEMPLRRSSQLLIDFATTLKNTARWQISSSLLHGFMGSVQSAYYYAQDLNESLNNIRIVTGKNTDQMAEFAKEANMAAQALSTTTTAYTDASLIYYQQGLDDEQVKERTDVTIKMANVARESATEVSEQLTAVWNNFAKGGENLEYYADVMTALGAATASSSAEIAEGLEKFAAVADTVGLSYEYATSALATVTATTRQSADIVGNAFKTLFARIQGLKLGDTLEDGTDLNKYSAALDAVGINIKKTNGDIKDMDTILNELGNKWKTLGKDQQMALAQTVAGVRQYTQLIALMDNWEFFQENLATARGAGGSLQEQADIYAESWEAAQKRVKAAAESIYQDLLNDNFFIELNNSFAKLLELINKLIKGLGGVQGVLLIVGNGLLKLFGSQLATNIDNTIYSLRMLTKEGKESVQKTKTEINKLIQQFYSKDNNENIKLIGEAYASQGQAQQILIDKAKNLSVEQQKIATILAEQHQTLVDNVVAQAEMAKKAEQTSKSMTSNYLRTGLDNITDDNEKQKVKENLQKYFDESKKAGKFSALQEPLFGSFTSDSFIPDKQDNTKINKNFESIKNNINEVIKKFGDLGKSAKENGDILEKEFGKEGAEALKELWEVTKDIDTSEVIPQAVIDEIIEKLNKLGDANIQAQSGTTAEGEAARQAATENYELADGLEKAAIAANEAGQRTGEAAASAIMMNQNLIGLGHKLDELKQKLPSVGVTLTAFGQAVTSAAMLSNSISNTFKTLTDSSASFSDKIISLTYTIGLAIPALLNFKKALKTIQEAGSLAAAGIEAVTAVINVALTLIFVAVQIVSVAHQKYVEKLDNTAKASERLAKASKETGDKLKEEKEHVDKLAVAYNDLKQQYENEEITLEDLRSQVYDLCIQYDLEDLRIKTLSASYKELTGIIRDYQIAKNEKLIEQNKETQELTQTALNNRIWANLDSKARDTREEQRTIDIGGYFKSNFRDLLKQFNISTYGKAGHIDLAQFVEAATENYDELYKALQEEGSNNSLQLLKIMEDNEALIKQYTTAQEETLTAQKNIIGLNVAENVTNTVTFSNAVEDMKKAALEKDLFADVKDPAKEAEKWAETWLLEYNKSFSKYAQAYDISKEIVKAIGGNPKEVQSLLEKYDSDVLTFIGQHQQTIIASGGKVQEVIEQLNDYFNLIQKKQNISETQNLLTTLAEGKDFKPEDLDSFYNKTDFKVDRDQFEAMGVPQQTISLLKYFSSNKEAILKIKDESIKELEDFKDKVNDKLIDINKTIDRYNQALGNTSKIEYLYNLEGFDPNKYEEYSETITNYIKQGYEKLSDEDKKRIKDIEEHSDKLEKAIKYRRSIYKSLLEAEEQKQALLNEKDDYDSLIKSIKEATTETEAYKAAQQGVSVLSKDIDAIQSAYSNLTDIIESYNQNQGFTLDSLQKLLSLDPMYLQALEIQGNQLSINEEYLVELTKARLEETKALIYEEGYNKLLALANNDAALAASNATIAQANAGNAAEIAGNQAKDAAAKWKDLIASQQGSFSAAEQQIIDDTEKRIQSIDNVIKNLNVSSFKKIASTGNKSSSKKDKEQKKLEEEFDRYWDIKKAIDAVDKAIARLDKDQENLYGRELINSLKEENKLLEQQKVNYEALAAAQREEAGELQGLLSGYGVAFDASGAINNYAAATSAALVQYNDAITKYNAGLLNDSEFKVYEDNYNKFKKAIDRYDQLFYTEMQDTKDKLDELWRKELANNLKAWEVNIQFKLDMKELKRGWNDFIKDIEEDFQKIYKDLRLNIKTLAEDADTYLGQDGTIGTITNAVRDVTREIDKMRGGGQSDMFESISQAQEKLKELNSTLQDSARAMKQLWEDAWNSYLEGIDQVSNQFDDLIDRFEKINDELEFQKELIELLYGPEAYALMTKYYEGQQKNTLEQMSSIKQQADMWEKLWRDSGATMENQNDWTADQKRYYEQWQEAQSDLNDLVLEYIRLLKDDYLNTVNDVLKQLEQGITGSSLSDLETEWERISAHADKYYDNVEGAYEIQKLANKINESIANTDNLKAQQKLQALREKEIKYLREKDNLTKYDLDAAEARYQIALKENALEEAKNNKTSMKLTRNEQGNWSYQYIADEEDTANKQQELLEAYSQLYQLASDAYENNLQALQDLQQKYLDSARTIYEDETLSEEERQQKLLELRDWYLNEYKLLSEENTLYRNDLELGAAALLLEIYNQDNEAYTAMTESEQELLDELITAHIDGFMDLEEKLKDNYNEIGDKAKEVMTETRADWTSGAQQIADMWNKDNGASVKSQVVNAYERIMDANIRYQNLVDQCAIIVERDFSEEGIAGAIMRAEEETDNLRYKTEDLVSSSIPYLDELRSYVDTIGDAWRSVQDEIRDAISLIEEYLRYMGEANRAAVESIQAANRAAMESFSSAPAASKSSTINEVKGARQVQTTGWTDWMHAAPKTSYSGSYQGNDSQMSAVLGGTENAGQKGQVRISYSNTTETDDLWRKYGVRVFQGYATGGYTGEWENGSTDGRLALLHQKELVLNESDTSNFLSAIKTLRDMTSLNNSITGIIADSIANLIVGLGKKAFGGNISTVNNNGSNTNNTFNITAEFPNAENMNEIKQAILTLPNIASQYIAVNAK